MRSSWIPFLILLAGCDGARFWKDRYVQEVNLHYQTQQIKNAEIAARELEIETQKSLIAILEDRLRTSGAASADREIEAEVIAVVPGIDFVMLSVGREGGVEEGAKFSITRKGEAVGSAVVQMVGAKGAAARLVDKNKEPTVGDTAVRRAVK